MPKINIRYNTNFPENSRYQWRVLIDGIEKLANDVKILTPCYTTSEKIEGVGIKYHITTNSDNIKINTNTNRDNFIEDNSSISYISITIQ